jgi:hypothetical protein
MSIVDTSHLFGVGLRVFIEQYCKLNQTRYSFAMLHQGGYDHAVKQFFIHSDQLDQYQEGVIPDWMKDVFIVNELDYFNQNFFQKRVVK